MYGWRMCIVMCEKCAQQKQLIGQVSRFYLAFKKKKENLFAAFRIRHSTPLWSAIESLVKLFFNRWPMALDTNDWSSCSYMYIEDARLHIAYIYTYNVYEILHTVYITLLSIQFSIFERYFLLCPSHIHFFSLLRLYRYSYTWLYMQHVTHDGEW